MLPLAAALLALTVMSAWKSVYFDLYEQNEIPRYRTDAPWALLLLLAAVIVLASVLQSGAARRATGLTADDLRQGEARRQNAASRWLLPAALTVAGTISLAVLFLLRPQPYADSIAVSKIAEEFLRGDYRAFSPAGGDDYLTVYPFQIGFIAFLELVYAVFGSGRYLALQLMNAAAAVVMVRNLSELTGEVFGKKTQPYFLPLSALMLPLFFKVGFLYGDVCGWSLAIGAFLLLFRWLRDNRKRHVLWAGVLLAAAILLKTNEMIFLVAMVMILLAAAFVKKSVRLLWMPAYLIACVLLLGTCVESVYTHAAGLERFPQGAPKTSWIAMGLQEDEYAEYGWYNGYNRNNYAAHGYDYDAANAAAVEDIRRSVRGFAQNPGHALYFFYKKFVSTWNDPAFQSQISMEWGSRHVENLSPLANSVLYGGGRRALYQVMNGVHFVVLALAAWRVLLSFGRREKERQWKTAAFLLPVFGGMAFHLLWETQCHYVIVYYCMLFPVAADGLREAAVCGAAIGKRWSRKI